METLESRRVLASVSGQVIYDFDGDGALENFEPGLADWRAFVDSNNNGRFDDGEPSDISDASGAYTIEDLTPQPHSIRVVAESGWRVTRPPVTGRYTVDLRNGLDRGGIDFGYKRDFVPFAPGNILVNRSSFSDTDLLLEYTPGGQLIQAIVIPGTEDFSRLIAKDLVVDGNGKLQIFNGYDDVRLTTFDPATETFANTFVATPDAPDWDMGRAVDAWGDIAAVGSYIFANEHRDTTGAADGLIRFNTSDLSFERFSTGVGVPTDVSVGLDGLLYTLETSFNNTTIRVFDPLTMDSVRTMNIAQPLKSMVVDEDGNLYALTAAGATRFAANGTPQISSTLIRGDDISIGVSGQLLISSPLQVQVADLDFGIVSTVHLPGDATVNFTGFASFVQAPVGDGIGGGGGEFGPFTAGNILVANSSGSGDAKLREYTAYGTLVQEFDLPRFEPSGARDLILDSQGNVQIFNGTFEPRLSTFESAALGFTHTTFDGWSMIDSPNYGGMAVFGDYFYAADAKTDFDSTSQRGIVRYNVVAGTFERFHSQHGGVVDVNVGLDGLLYALGANGRTVRQYNPISMQLIRTIQLPAVHRAIAVDANGDIFAVNPDIHHYNRNGNVLAPPRDDDGVGGLADIDIDQEGRLLVTSSSGFVLVTNRDLRSLVTFPSGSGSGLNFAAFVSSTRPFPKAFWDYATVDEDSVDNVLDVLANDRLAGIGALSITGVSPTENGGVVQLLGNTQLNYTPAYDFVGIDRFTYTLSDGLGGTDTALVEVTVAGTANFFAFDDSYTFWEDNEFPQLPPTFGVLDNDGQLDIFPVFRPGNILVVHSPIGEDNKALLQEYTTGGVLVRSKELPDFSGGFADVRDLVLDRNGNAQIFNGTFDPRLTTYDPVSNLLTHTQIPDWNSTTDVTYGGTAAWRDFVFLTDQRVVGDDLTSRDGYQGIIRYDIRTGISQRFARNYEFTDVTVGLDGLVYALGPGGVNGSEYIRVYEPRTMNVLREIVSTDPTFINTRAITVNENGEIFAVQRGGTAAQDATIRQYDRDGNLMRAFNTGLGDEAFFSDIDIHENGRNLLISNVNFSNVPNNRDADLILTTTSFAFVSRLQAPDSSSDMKFATWVQAPVGSLNGPLTIARVEPPSHGTLVVNSDGSFTYDPDLDYAGADAFEYVVRDAEGQQREASVSLTVLPLNDTPVLVPNSPSATSDEDKAYTFPLTSIVNGELGTTHISDVDPYDPLGGIAVTGLDGPGLWSFSTNGATFINMGVVSDDQALLLPFDADIRFTPSGGSGGVATLTYQAWDETRGSRGNKTDTTLEFCLPGSVIDIDGFCFDGIDQTPPLETILPAFSEEQDTFTLTMSDLNDAPFLIPAFPFLGVTDEETPFEIGLNAFVVGITDPDGLDGFHGLALTAADGNGRWQYQHAGGTFQDLPAVSDQAALLLIPGDRLQYIPDQLNGEVVGVRYRAWDRSDGATPGTIVSVSTNGGDSAYSTSTDLARLRVDDVNDAPQLAPVGPALGDTDVVTVTSFPISSFVSGISDVDTDDLLGGIAITATTGAGSWAYSPAGSSFTPFPAISSGETFLLARGYHVRYTPTGGAPETATLTYRAWDASSGTAGGLFPSATTGGETPLSTATDTATLIITEINDPPEIDLMANSLTYTENDAPLRVFANAILSDPNGPALQGGALRAQILSGGTPSDFLSISDVGGIQTTGSSVWYDAGAGPQLLGTYSIDGWVLTVDLTTPDARIPSVQALARAIVYRNVSENPSSADRLVTLAVRDGDHGNDTGTVTQTVTITPVNDPPLATGDLYTLASGGTLSVSFTNGVLVNDQDVEGDLLSAQLVDVPLNGSLTFNSDGSFTYQPEPLFFGLDTFSYRAFDGQDSSQLVTVGLDVLLTASNPSHPADINGDGYLSPLDAVLIENFLLEYPSGNLPAGFSAPPFVDFNGDGRVTFADVDGVADTVNSGGSRPLPPPRLVLPQNPDVLGPGEFVRIELQASDAQGAPIDEINAGQTFYLDILVSDRRVTPTGVAAAFLDVLYDAGLVSTIQTPQAGGDFPLYLSGNTNGIDRVDLVGAGRKTPLADGEPRLLARIPFRAETRGVAMFDAEAADQRPAGQVLLFGIDGEVPAENVTLVATSLTITGPPIAMDDVYDVDEDDQLEVPASLGVLDNDFDPEGDALTAVLVESPQHGALTFVSNGAFRYVPDGDFFGTDYFTYRANDGFFESETAEVTIQVAGSNDAPVAEADRYGVFRNETLDVKVANGVLSNDVDPDGDMLTVSLVRGPEHGQLTLSANGSFVYHPDQDFGGKDSFTYQLSDSQTLSNVATVELDVLFGWQNPTHPVDVSGDGYASPLDAVLIFNDLARNGSRTLPNPPVAPNFPPPFIDWNGNGFVSSFDGRKVLEDLDLNGSRLLPQPRLELEQMPPAIGDDLVVNYRLETVDASKLPSAEFGIGEKFTLNVYVQDISSFASGIFSAYVDVVFDGTSITTTGPLAFGDAFPLVRNGNVTNPGILDEVGGVHSATIDESAGELLLFSVEMEAERAGQFSLIANAADALPIHETTLFGYDGPVSVDNMGFMSAMVEIFETDNDGDGVQNFVEDAGPFTGDGNQDSVPDREQSHVASFQNDAEQPYITLVSTTDHPLSGVQASDLPAPQTAPADVEFSAGFFQMNVHNVSQTETTVVTIRLESGATANTFYRFGSTADNPSPHWHPFLFDGTTGARVFSDRIELSLRDARRGDNAAAPDGIVMLGGAVGMSSKPWQNPEIANDVNNDRSVTALDVLSLVNDINANGQRDLPLVPVGDAVLPMFLDVDGDNKLLALDVLNIVNDLNQQQDGGGEGEPSQPSVKRDQAVLDLRGTLLPALSTPSTKSLLSSVSVASNGGERVRAPAPVAADDDAFRRAGPELGTSARVESAAAMRSIWEDATRESPLEDAITDIAGEIDQFWTSEMSF